MKFFELTDKPRPDDGSEPIIKAFVKFASQKLGLKEPPNIKLHRNPKLASQRRSFGGYMPGQGIEINIGNRHIMDVLRTLAHEMVHYKQDIMGQLKPDSGKDGSDEENEANAKAAVIMRLWGKMNPELFQHATILAESQKRKLKEFNLPWSSPSAQPAPAATSAFPQQQPATPVPAAPKPQAAAPAPKPVAPPSPPAFEPADHKETLIKVAKKNGIKKPNDLASLLGQVTHETMNWTKSVENLKYTDANRIYRLFTSAIPNEKAAAPYVNNPVALANVAYAGKNGNGDARSGDGWRYRGRGFLQVTGRANYQMVGQLAHPENPTIYVDNPDLLSTNPVESARAAVAYFIKRVGLGKSVKYATRQINPAGVGAKSRVAAVKQAKRAMTERLDKTAIHKLADKKGIKWDDEPAFLKLTKQVTGHRYLDDLGQDDLFKMKNYLDNIDENFADGKHPEDKGDSARHGIPKKASLSTLDKITHSNASPRKRQLAHWQANMRRGRNKNG